MDQPYWSGSGWTRADPNRSWEKFAQELVELDQTWTCSPRTEPSELRSTEPEIQVTRFVCYGSKPSDSNWVNESEPASYIATSSRHVQCHVSQTATSPNPCHLPHHQILMILPCQHDTSAHGSKVRHVVMPDEPCTRPWQLFHEHCHMTASWTQPCAPFATCNVAAHFSTWRLKSQWELVTSGGSRSSTHAWLHHSFPRRHVAAEPWCNCRL